jgi:hypothetical protein
LVRDSIRCSQQANARPKTSNNFTVPSNEVVVTPASDEAKKISENEGVPMKKRTKGSGRNTELFDDFIIVSELFGSENDFITYHRSVILLFIKCVTIFRYRTNRKLVHCSIGIKIHLIGNRFIKILRTS